MGASYCYMPWVCSKWIVGAGPVPALGTYTGVPLQPKLNAPLCFVRCRVNGAASADVLLHTMFSYLLP
jgi:hypothetical protein